MIVRLLGFSSLRSWCFSLRDRAGGLRRVASIAAGSAVAFFGVTGWSSASQADVVYVQTAPPPPDYYAPPPPPPRYYYRSRRYRYYDEDPEPLYALDLGVDLEGAVPLNLPRFLDGNNVQGGGGIKVRIGEQVRLRGGLLFTPEAGFGYDHLFASDDAGNDYSWDMDRVFGGARLAFGRFLVPVIYAHLGYGWRRTGDPTVPEASGLAFDVGGALDLRVVPRLGMGVHIEYATIDAHPYAPSWLALGLHLDLLF